jgi:hypothetical protein
VFSFGGAQFYGSIGSLVLQRPIVGIAATPNRLGYWLIASDGGVFAFGDASYYGSIPGLGIAPAGSVLSGPALTAPIIGIMSSPDGRGYLLVGADGGVFAFGDATFSGSCYQFPCGSNTAVAAAVPDKTGRGYWFLTTIGTSYNFGDAPASCFAPPQAIPVTSASGPGNAVTYDFVFANGWSIDCGNVSFGSAFGQLAPGDKAAAIVLGDNDDYWIATARGAVFAFGVANYGSMAGKHLNAPIIGAAGW